MSLIEPLSCVHLGDQPHRLIQHSAWQAHPFLFQRYHYADSVWADEAKQEAILHVVVFRLDLPKIVIQLLYEVL